VRYFVVFLAILVFVGISFLLARVLAADSRERSDLADLLRAQARGDAAAMLRELHGCADAPGCTARVQSNAERLRRPGAVKVVRLDPSTTFALSGHTGPARVVWNTSRVTRPVVQCVLVRRTGNVLSGPGVQLESVSGPRPGESSC
jgi:3,4-dihydroxy-2-butanone 4-phosphate synthase